MELFFVHSKFDIEKHVACEPCGKRVIGGFDPERKQVSQIIFHNMHCMYDVIHRIDCNANDLAALYPLISYIHIKKSLHSSRVVNHYTIIM